MPDSSTVREWVRRGERDPDGVEGRDAFPANYARARDDQAWTIAERILDIAARPCETKTDVARARNEIDAAKWWAGKIAPKTFGDNHRVEITDGRAEGELVQAALEAQRRLKVVQGVHSDVQSDVQRALPAPDSEE